MCYSRKLYHKVSRLHEKCLRIIYNDKTSSYEELLSKDGSVCMHHKNQQQLVIEICNGLCIQSMNEIFQFQIQNHHNLRNNSTFRIPSFNTVFKAKESVSYPGPKKWNQVPKKTKYLEYLTRFKKAIKKWVPRKCQFKYPRFLFNVYFTSVDFH